MDGTVQTHTSPGLAMITEIREIGEMGCSITHKLINTTGEVLLERRSLSQVDAVRVYQEGKGAGTDCAPSPVIRKNENSCIL